MRASYSIEPRWFVCNSGKEIELLEDWCFTVDGTDFWVHEGYRCDGASIPWLFKHIPFIGRPFDKNNAIGAWAHDPLFLTRVLGFSGSNEVARLLWIQAGKSNFSARAMWMAIESPFGRISYVNTEKDKHNLAMERTKIKWREDWRKFESMWFAPERK